MTTKKRAKKQDSPSAGAEKRKKTEQMKTWAKIARLADAGLTALDAGKMQDVRACLKAIRGVALTADERKL
jgi:hypothetical protein